MLHVVMLMFTYREIWEREIETEQETQRDEREREREQERIERERERKRERAGEDREHDTLSSWERERERAGEDREERDERERERMIWYDMTWYEMRRDDIMIIVIISSNSCISIHVEQASPTHGCNAVSNPIKNSIHTWTNMNLTSKADRSEKKTTRNSKHKHLNLKSRARLWKPRARFGNLGRELGSNEK